ncbi:MULTISPECIES: hypothetical protein [Rhodococcus]|uniref:Uncharacterized protein n=1 Tax=Rhodococcus qingshengii JCM 15477 TaxID=1303681 RepID=A0AB38RNH2_RHOSG|nr:MULTISPECIES: hypothetical protein [Rhodococcus]UPU46920.1 hypothetical protein M0639_34395 [Rhodococcus qingshengii JCM 15477]
MTNVECTEVAIFDAATDNDIVSAFHNAGRLDIELVLIGPEPQATVLRDGKVVNTVTLPETSESSLVRLDRQI